MACEADGPSGVDRYYTVENSVGAGGLNRKDDAMLIQFFLDRIYKHPFSDYKPPVGTGPMKVDGQCGPITRRYITDFQQTVQSRDLPGGDVVVDGRVDPVLNAKNDALGRRSIVLLNRLHAKYYPYDSDPRASTEAPPFLRAALSRSIMTWGGGI